MTEQIHHKTSKIKSKIAHFTLDKQLFTTYFKTNKLISRGKKAAHFGNQKKSKKPRRLDEANLYGSYRASRSRMTISYFARSR